MPTLGTTALTLADVIKRVDPDGKIAKVVEILNKTNEVLLDQLFVEGNLATGHRTTVRSGLPAVAWRLLNYGVQPSKSTTVQVDDVCGMLEAYAQVDKRLAELSGNVSEFRLSEDIAFIEAMNQEYSKVLFYGNTALDPEKFLGMAPRYSSLSADNAKNIIDGLGTASGTSLTSVWLIVWGNITIHGIYPKGKATGLHSQDLGEDTLIDSAGGLYQGYRNHYTWDVGLSVRDWRYAVRIANVDIATLTKNAASGADLIDLMTQAVEKIPAMGMGSAAWYVPGIVRSFLRRQIANKVINSTLEMQDVAGKRVLTFDEIPVRRVDAIITTETRVT